MGKQTSCPAVKRGRFKSGRIWKEPRTPAASRTRSKALKTSWRSKMKLKSHRDQIKSLEREMRQATQEVRRAERERVAARKKRKEANQLKDKLTKSQSHKAKLKGNNSRK